MHEARPARGSPFLVEILGRRGGDDLVDRSLLPHHRREPFLYKREHVAARLQVDLRGYRAVTRDDAGVPVADLRYGGR